MDSFYDMQAFIEQHMPSLDVRLTFLHTDEVREILNDLTGCRVMACDPLDEGSRQWMPVLRELATKDKGH